MVDKKTTKSKTAKCRFGISIPLNRYGALKVKNFGGKPTVVDSDSIKIPREIANIKKTVILTAETLFVKGIQFFIYLSRKIDFTGVGHLKGRTAAIIFDAFKAVFRLYLHRGFHI